MTEPLRIAALGFWHVHAGDYALRAQEHPGTELVAVWDDDVRRGSEAAQEFSVELVEDLDELLGRDDIDAVTVTTATSTHRDVMVRAAAAGKHIFTEKLLAPTVAGAEDIIRAADQNGVALTVSLPRLYHGYTRTILGILESGELGRLTHSRVRLSHDGASHGWLPDRFFDPVSAIGGALTDLGCHPAYLTQLFLGTSPEVVSATYRSVTGRAVEDSAVVTVAYGDASIGVIEAGFVSDSPFTIELFGTEGSLAYSDWERALKVSGRASGGRGWQQVDILEDSPDPFARWIDHIATGTRADDNLMRAVELTRLVVAANAAATGSPGPPSPP